MKLPEITRIPGQGEERKASDTLLRAIVQGVDNIRSQAAGDIWTRRRWSDNVRYCLWDGQSDDGRKRDEYLDEPAFPFDGASDARVRLADFVLRVQTATLKQAVKRSSIRVRPMEANDTNTAGHLNTLANWLLNNRIAGAWRMHIERLATWGNGDSPAIALLHVYQDRRDVVRMKRMTIDELVMWLQETIAFDASPLAVETVGELLLNPERRDELIALVAGQFPALKPATLRKAIKTLLAQGSADFPVVETLLNEPRIEALRMWDDVFVPTHTRDPENCQVVYVRRWLTLPQLEEKERLEAWSSAAIDLLTGRNEDQQGSHEGQSYIVEADNLNGAPLRNFDETSARSGLFEVITAYIKGVTDDGVTGVFTCHFSGHIDQPLSTIKLLDYPHGGFPFVWYVREYTSTSLLDARGICELLQTDQDFLKTLRDLSADHTQLFTLPPWKHNITTPEREIRFTPLALIRTGTNSIFEPIQIPQGSDLPLKHIELLYQQVSLYTGVPIVEVASLIQSVLTQDMVDDFISVIRDTVHMLLQLAVALMDEDQLRDICNAPDLDIQSLRDGMVNLRDIHLDFNAANFDVDYLKTISEVIASIRSFDTEKTIADNELVDYLIRQFSPTLANRAVRPLEVAQAAEIEDEKKNIALIEAGIDPEMVEQGQNYNARLQTLLTWLDFRQQAAQQGQMPPLAPMHMQIVQARVKHLQGQLQQQQNAITGRTMSEKVSPV
jgi:hypothetical protein